MMQNYLFTLLFALLVFPSSEATAYANVHIDIVGEKSQQPATTILEKVATQINIAKGAYAEFTISGARFGTSNGSIAMKGNKFNVRTNGNIIWYDGKTQWLYNTVNEEVNISTPSAAQQQSMNPYHFLNIYKKGYKLSMTKTGKDYVIHLIGSNKSTPEMFVTVDSKYNIKQIKRKQGNEWITINISFIRQKSYSDAAFRFSRKDYPKAEIIDLR